MPSQIVLISVAIMLEDLLYQWFSDLPFKGRDRKTQRMAKFSPQKFLAQVGNGKTTLTCPKKRILFSQGDVADAVFYIQTGQVKLSVISSQGKEAIVAMLEPGAFSVKGVSPGRWCAWPRQPLRKKPRSCALTNRR